MTPPSNSWTGCCAKRCASTWFQTFLWDLSVGASIVNDFHYAAEASSHKLKTFSISFQGRRFDESVYFRESCAATRPITMSWATQSRSRSAERDRGICVLLR